MISCKDEKLFSPYIFQTHIGIPYCTLTMYMNNFYRTVGFFYLYTYNLGLLNNKRLIVAKWLDVSREYDPKERIDIKYNIIRYPRYI